VSATYAGVKGRTAALPQRPAPPAALRPLSAVQAARVAENKALVEAHLPEMLPFFRDLYAEGLVDGWRAVVSVSVFEGMNHGSG
jgi:hypothetical protein